MKGPFLLPNNIKEGDYIEIGQLGAMGLHFEQNLMDFSQIKFLELQDKPIMSMYDETTNLSFPSCLNEKKMISQNGAQ